MKKCPKQACQLYTCSPQYGNCNQILKNIRIAPKVLLPGAGAKGVKKDSLCQKSGYRGRDG